MAEFIFPNTSPNKTSKHNLEPSIISNAPFSVGFLERIIPFNKWQNAPFRHVFGVDQIGTSQETPFIGVSEKIDYIRPGNVKCNDQFRKLPYLWKSLLCSCSIFEKFQISRRGDTQKHLNLCML